MENGKLSRGMDPTVGPAHAKKATSIGSGITQNNATKGAQRQHHRTFYSTLRSDRMGAVVQDMLVAHAHAFQRGLVYAGACPPTPSSHGNGILGSTTATAATTTNVSASDVTAVLHALGLQTLLHVACPPAPSSATFSYSAPPVVDRSFYTKQGLQVCTPEWQRFVHSTRAREMGHRERQRQRTDHSDKWAPGATNAHRPPRAVVHIRRGDVTPCAPNPDVANRYLPNSYYLRVVREHVPPNHSIVVYSESKSFEPWNNFRTIAPDWEFRLDSDPIAVWIDMIEADVLILSKSSFSLVPALLLHPRSGGDSVDAPSSAEAKAKAVVVCPDQWMTDPLAQGWMRVPPAWQREAEHDIESLRQERCPKT